jgi:hypothetical protein
MRIEIVSVRWIASGLACGLLGAIAYCKVVEVAQANAQAVRGKVVEQLSMFLFQGPTAFRWS